MIVKCTDNSKAIAPLFTVGKTYEIKDNGEITCDDGYTFGVMNTAEKQLEFIRTVYGFEVVSE